MNREESMHVKIRGKIAELAKRIRTGIPLPGNQKLVDQDAEGKLLEIVDWYSGNIDGISAADARLIATTLELSLGTNFWYADTEAKIKKAVSNLEKLFVERYKKKYKWELQDSSSNILGECDCPEDVAKLILEKLKDPNREKHDDWAEQRDSWFFYVKEFIKPIETL
jgi:hypothetical protein